MLKREFIKLKEKLVNIVKAGNIEKFKSVFHKNRLRLSVSQVYEIREKLYDTNAWDFIGAIEKYFPWPDDGIPTSWKEWCWKNEIYSYELWHYAITHKEIDVEKIKKAWRLMSTRTDGSPYFIPFQDILEMANVLGEQVLDVTDTKYLQGRYQYFQEYKEFILEGYWETFPSYRDWGWFLKHFQYGFLKAIHDDGEHWVDYLDLLRVLVKAGVDIPVSITLAKQLKTLTSEIDLIKKILGYARAHYYDIPIDVNIAKRGLDMNLFWWENIKVFLASQGWPKKTVKKILKTLAESGFDFSQGGLLWMKVYQIYFGPSIFDRFNKHFYNWDELDHSFVVASWLKHNAERSNYLFKPRELDVEEQRVEVYWAARIDEIRACDIERVNESAESVLRKMQDRVKQEKIQEYQRKNYQVAKSPLGDAPELGIKFLPDAKSIGLEGEFMNHCVWGYAPGAKTGSCYIYHIGPDAPKGATAEVQIRGTYIVVPQIYGYGDSEPRHEYVKVFMDWVKKQAKRLNKRVRSSYLKY